MISAQRLPGLLEIQRRHAAAGQPVRLAQLVVVRGFATREAVLAALGPSSGRPCSGVSEDDLPTLRPLMDSADETTTLKLNRGPSAPVHEERVGEGEQRLGAYIVERELGRGGMGAVLLARDPRLGRRVAIKQILGELKGEILDRFDTEARLGARLRHPGIAGVHELVTEGEGAPYLVMEYVEGRTLKEAFKFQSFSGARLAGTLRQLCEALEVAHGLGIIHRDLKPDNVVLAKDDRPVVLDFGIAKDVERSLSESRQSLTKTGDVMGTPAFMSPEQADSSKDVDARTDVYALGGILYQGLAGRPPFTGNAQQVLTAIFAKDPEAPSALAAEVHPDLETIALKCLEKNPAQRYQSAAELGEELGRFLEGEPIQARPVSRGQRLWRRVKRSRGPVLVAALLLTVLGLGGALALREPGLDQEIYGEALRALDELGEIQTFRYRPLMEKEEDEEKLIRRARKRTEAVLKRLDRLVEKSGGDPRLLVLKGKALAGSFQWDEAERVLLSALEKDPKQGEAHRQLGLISIKRSSFQWFSGDDFDPRRSRREAKRALNHLKKSESLGSSKKTDQLAEFWLLLGQLRTAEARSWLESSGLDRLGLAYRFGNVLLAFSDPEFETSQAAWKEMQRRLDLVLEACPRHFPSLVLNGMLRRFRGELEAARRSVALAVMLSPNDYSANLLLGGVERDLGQYEDSEEHLGAAIRQRPEASKAYSQLARVHFMRGDAEKTRSAGSLARQLAKGNEELAAAHLSVALAESLAGDDEACLEKVRLAHSLAPQDSVILFHLGAGLLRKKQYREALKFLNKSLNVVLRNGAKPDAALLLNRGVAYSWLGELEKGHRDFVAARALLGERPRPDVRRPLGFSLAKSLQARGELERAMEELMDLIERGLADSEVYAAMAFLEILRDRNDPADQYSAEAMRLAPKGHAPNAVRAAVWLIKRQWEKAEACARVALEIKPDNSDVLSILGEAVRCQDRTAEADKLFERVLDLNPRDSRALRGRGYLAVARGEWELANGLFKRYLALRKPNFLVLRHYGRSKSEVGEFREAARLFDQALKLNPDSGEIHSARGFMALRLKDWASARKSFDKSLAIKPSADAHRGRALALNRLGRNDEAIRNFEAFLRLDPKHPSAESIRGFVKKLKGAKAKGS